MNDFYVGQKFGCKPIFLPIKNISGQTEVQRIYKDFWEIIGIHRNEKCINYWIYYQGNPIAGCHNNGYVTHPEVNMVYFLKEGLIEVIN